MTRPKSPTTIPVLLALLLLAGAPVPTHPRQSDPTHKVCVREVCFPETETINGAVLPMRGAGLLRWMGFMVYTSALYVPADAKDVLADIPKVLVLHYHREITAEDLAKSTKEFLRKDKSNDYPKLRERVERVSSKYSTVDSGDEYVIRYHPETGTEIWLNGTFVDRFEGADFARAFYGIWLGKECISDTLRDKLTGARKSDGERRTATTK